MEINNELKSQLLSLDDASLKNVVDSVARAAGVGSSKLNISQSDISKIRDVISKASDKDAENALKLVGGDKLAKEIIDRAKKNQA